MATTRRSRRNHVLSGIALGLEAAVLPGALLLDPTFTSRLGSFLSGPKQTPEIPKVERPETLTEALLRKKRLLRLMTPQGSLDPNAAPSAGLGVQAAQGPAGSAGGLLGGPVAPMGTGAAPTSLGPFHNRG